MSHEESTLAEMISTLKQRRDELAVKIHLGKEEAKQEWDQLEEKWNSLISEYEPVKDAVGETAENVVSGLKLTAGEIKDGFDRIWKAL
ncbi:MAG: hypothetical protein OES79_07410 [Planctomycetota bacterium]|nr:hypothetical protein [Planctomycetota bacterium]